MKKGIICILIICIFAFFFYFTHNNCDKFEKLGYSEKDVKIIHNKVSKNDYELFLKNGYDKSLIDILNCKGYEEKNFEKYLKYYLKNKKANIKDIITIINSGYDLMNYPASSLLAGLVQEKYYINDNVARYLDYGNSHKVSFKKIIAMKDFNKI